MTKKTDPTTTEPTGETDGNPDGNAGTTDWKAAYQGLQTKYNTLHTQAETWKNERDEAITNLTTARAELSQAKDGSTALETKVSGFEAKVSELEGKVAQGENAIARSRLIIEKFPDLAKFEAKGLLPTAGEDGDLEAKLTAFRETLSENVQKKVDATLDGSVPPQEEETTDDDLSDDALYEKMMAVAGKDDGEFSRLQAISDTRSKKQT